MRTYERTHPWIKFTVDLRQASANFWMLLGEARSKCEHIANVPLRPATAQKLHELYLAKGVLATTAIEGNTLSEQEVLQHLEGKLRLPPSKEYLAQEIDNIVRACNQMVRAIEAGTPLALSVDTIKQFNRLVLEGLEVEGGVVPGEMRQHSVGVAGYRLAPAEDCEYLLDRLCQWLNGPEFMASREAPEMELAYAILKAILAHLYVAWIHPFSDGNGRTARLIEFFILVTSSVPMPAAHLLSNHYNQTRAQYYRQLDQASQSGGDVLPFLNYALRGFVDGLRSQLDLIRQQQWDIAWENHIHERFRHRTTPGDVRRRHLILDLSERDEPVPMSKILEVSPRVAAAYATKTPKTLARDLKVLLEMELVEARGNKYRARKEVILAFLPLRRKAEAHSREMHG
jgi:Fic family protein